MAELLMIKTGQGLFPCDEDGVRWLSKKKLGAHILVSAREMRNGLFHRKWFSLVQLGFDYWTETAEMPEYKGQPIAPNFERFRKDLTILAGYWHPVPDINGKAKPEADSISWAKMDEETFEKLYSATITALLNYIYSKDMTEEKLRNWVDSVMAYA